ncbi:MAG TPA: TonB-dependent receptor plug domain-containing protein, partial [Candidatus Angelobacter sp.]|nr:TonB-dependent receptor plug domain-containing protein [Candidatus Angelobacter sp.]
MMTCTPFQKNRGVVSSIVLLTLTFGSNLWSQSPSPTPSSKPTIQAKEEVVEVTTESVPVEASSASVVVLTRSYIEDSHAVSTADLLAAVPFLHVAQNGSAGSLTTASIRGGKDKFTLVLLDG